MSIPWNENIPYFRITAENPKQVVLRGIEKDYEFSPKELVSYWIAEGLIDDMGNWEKELDKGHTILNGLIDVCMLVRRFDHRIVMHDLITDLAIGITRKSPRFVVKVGMGIKGSIGFEEFTEDVDKISLMRNEIEMLSGEPNCPKLTTFLLHDNPLSRNISHCFFNHMNSLRVLNLSNTGIEYIPVSISNCESLCILLLMNCSRLREVPSLAKLKRLRVLNLSNTSIKELPHGMECWVNVKSFCLSSNSLDLTLEAYSMQVRRSNLIGQESYLVLPDSVIKLEMHGYDLSSLPCLSHLQRLQQSQIRGLCEGVLLPGSFACLKVLCVCGCHALENLMSLELFQNLQCLEQIKIVSCSEMEEVVQGEEAMVEEVLLLNLRELYLIGLGKLKSVCKRVIICPSLIWITVVGCHQLKKIPLSLSNSTSFLRETIKGSRAWWDAMEWGDPNSKSRIRPRFPEEEEDDNHEEGGGREGRGMKRKAEQQVEEVASTSRRQG
ncbi:putative disease resistance protein At4g10780 [Magnolia sinica]|uniref:putative disease resistance protein At4g10780 n=1 Tax=Magnolia sinica TaxID=86752 RepID=UPI0026580A1F|nr:putative disease resistance protein At4g10780 [Magnolia sinica]